MGGICFIVGTLGFIPGTKPDVDTLHRKLDAGVAANAPGALRARDFGVALVCAASRNDLEDRAYLYLGLFGTWFACRPSGVTKC